jgi:hypothetical protein
MIDPTYTVLTWAKEIRDRFGKLGYSGQYQLTVKVSGPVDQAQAKVEYILNNAGYGDRAEAAGSFLPVVIDEYIRRNGWEEKHAPRLLAAPELLDPVESVPEEEDKISLAGDKPKPGDPF